LTLKANTYYLIRLLIVIAIAFLYSFLVDISLTSLPYADTPEWFKSLFGRTSYAIPWIKLRHTAIVLLVSMPIGIIVSKTFKENVYLFGFMVGVLPIIYGEVTMYYSLTNRNLVTNLYSYINLRMEIPFWVTLTDIAVIIGAVLIMIWLSNRFLTTSNK